MLITVSFVFASSLNLPLFGNATLSRLENVTTFIAVQKFITGD